MTSLAIIPARGGSKGIPRKNVRLLAGKPLIAHTIEKVDRSGSVHRVVVSTDDPEIALVSEEHGAEVVPRPREISGDEASSESALLHALDYFRKNEGYEPDLLVFLQCTSPLTLPEDIDGTVAALLDEEADSALAVTPFHHFLWRQGEGGNAIGINHDKRGRVRRQDQDPQYLETGAVYVMRTEGFLRAKHRFFGKTAMYVMPPERVWEIDEPIDLRIAEVLMRERQQQQRAQALPRRIAALVLDFDGVFTDNKVLVLEDGREAVVCDRSDGHGLARVKALGIPVLVLSREENPVVQARCDKLGIPCRHGIRDKVPVLKEWLADLQIDLAQTVYVGNDVNDIGCLEAVGCGIAVADAFASVKASADVVLSSSGGQGAIREVCELIGGSIEE